MCEACLFCIYPLSAAVCTVLFPEHRNTADALVARPPSNPTARDRGPPMSTIARRPSQFKSEICTLKTGLCICLGFGSESRTGCNLEDSGVICSDDRLEPEPHFSYMPRRAGNVVQFRELAMVAQPEGALHSIRFAYNPLFRLNQALLTKEEQAYIISYFCHRYQGESKVNYLNICMIWGYGYDVRSELISDSPPLFSPRRTQTNRHIFLSLDRSKRGIMAVTRIPYGDTLVVY